MNICNGCGGIVGRDCFNPIECEQITASMMYDSNTDYLLEKINQCLELADGLPFIEFYSHTNVDMFKIKNLYTKYAEEKLVLLPVSEGFENSLNLAVNLLLAKKEAYFNYENPV